MNTQEKHCFALTASRIIYLGRHHAIRHQHMATHPRSQKLYIFRAIHTRKFTIFFRWPYISLGSRNNCVSFPPALIRHIRNHKQSDHVGSACCNGGEPTRHSHRNLIFKRNTQLPRTRLAYHRRNHNRSPQPTNRKLASSLNENCGTAGCHSMLP